MRVIHTIASTATSHGGPSRSVPQLCDALAACGVASVLVTAVADGERRVTPQHGAVSSVLPRRWPGPSGVLRTAWEFEQALECEVAVRRPDVIHDHGAWLPTNLATARVARRSGIPLVISTRGMFSRDAKQRRAARKRAAWLLYQQRIMTGASMLHATSEEEAADLRALDARWRVTVIRNGITIPQLPAKADGTQRVLCMTRLHPIKGLPLLLDAWATAAPSGWTLEIVGPSTVAYREELGAIVARDPVLRRTVVMHDEVSDDRKWNVYAAADLFVLPSYSENFGLVVAEALASALPVITTTRTPWRHLADRGCGWIITPDRESLIRALVEATTLPDSVRTSMGQRGREYATRELSWSCVAHEFAQLYATLSSIYTA